MKRVGPKMSQSPFESISIDGSLKNSNSELDPNLSQCLGSAKNVSDNIPFETKPNK